MNLWLIWRHRRGLRRTSTVAWRHRRGLARTSAAIFAAGLALVLALVFAVVQRRKGSSGATPEPQPRASAAPRPAPSAPAEPTSRSDDELADAAGEDSFPASDPPATY